MILVVFTKTKMQINWANVMFNNLHSKLKDLGNPSKFGVTQAMEFGGTQILDIMLRKWFSVDSSFRRLDLEEDEL
jgi:hypothetical protein